MVQFEVKVADIQIRKFSDKTFNDEMHYKKHHSVKVECIKHYGSKCHVCDFDFGAVYGEIAEGFINIHNKKQLSVNDEEYEADPINDLVPLCANCLSVVLLAKPAITIEELKGKKEKQEWLLSASKFY